MWGIQKVLECAEKVLECAQKVQDRLEVKFWESEGCIETVGASDTEGQGNAAEWNEAEWNEAGWDEVECDRWKRERTEYFSQWNEAEWLEYNGAMR